MKWTVLSDNRSNDSRLFTEHGLSILLETTNEREQCDACINIAERGGVRRSQTEQHRILLDTGASDVFIRNAEQLGVDLSNVDYVFISHGHSDHAGGLRYFLEHNQKAQIIVSPDAMSGQFYSKRGNLHSITTEWPEIDDDRLILINQTCEIAEELHAIAQIPQNHPIPKGNQNLFVKPNEQNKACFNSVMARKGRMKSNLYVQDVNGYYIHDDFRHELALYVDGLLFTGCAHSGLENILSACPWPVHTVVGGFHLLDGQETEKELAALAQRLKANYPITLFYTSHCTGDKVFEVMKSVMGEQLQSFKCGTVYDIDSHE
jgi:7,8-dihydropterin-6-yl-methyl-4-(beta-D-ribofuranosyl)aminobenzene 5'-phosphate synthase